MKHTYLFQYNVPAENQFTGRTDCYINVVAETDLHSYTDGKLIVWVNPVIRNTHDLISIKDWMTAILDMEAIAQKHFSGLIKNFPESNAKDITMSPEGKAAIALIDHLAQDHFEKIKTV